MQRVERSRSERAAAGRGGRAARVLLAVAAFGSSGGAVVAACGQSDDLPPLDRNLRNPIEAGADAPDVGPDAPEFGVILDPEAPCDDGLALDSNDPLEAARAVELCQNASDTTWGLVGARWTHGDGSLVTADQQAMFDLGHGIVPEFGKVTTQAGARMLLLSSGTGRRPEDPGYAAELDKLYTSPYPKGFPKASPSCPGVNVYPDQPPHDDVALEVELRAPDEAVGFAFRFDFHTNEWPDYVCTEFNDAFAALLSPPPPDHPDGNVSFDSKGNVVSVNAAFVRVCTCAEGPPCEAHGKKFACDQGGMPLIGTGFEGHAATGWLKTQALVAGGSTVTLRWTIYDAGDGILDSTTVIDDFQWLGEVDGGVMTEPEDPPE